MILIFFYISYLVVLKDDLYAFANVSYLMAISNDMLREHVTNSLVPTPPVSASVLMRLDKKQRCLASRMINLLLPLPDLDSKLPSVKTVMKHPFFTTNLETARRLLNFDAGIKNVEELEKFYKSIPAGANKDKDSFDGLMDLVSCSILKLLSIHDVRLHCTSTFFLKVFLRL